MIYIKRELKFKMCNYLALLKEKSFAPQSSIIRSSN